MAADYRLIVAGEAHEVQVQEADGGVALTIDGETRRADLRRVDGPVLTLLLDGRSFEVVAVERPEGFEILIGNQVFDVEVERPGRRRAEGIAGAGGPTPLRTPLTGIVKDVPVTAGEAVTQGQVLVVVESMKMNNEIRAPRDGTVTEVHVSAGARVERNALLVTIV
ncbi:MAG TPA: biotin/lipoyl-containing protein [Dehalococcoidia bacterium]|nr:biotin/lipoyl-containing protein [Dehalococcoidia bacterium]